MNLPTITFLCGPSGVGKTTLANALFDKLDGLQAHSLRAPLFNAARGAFFDCDPSLELTFEPTKRNIPGTGATVDDFTKRFHVFLDENYLPPALGRLAAHFATSATEFFDKVVFDDGDRSLIDDIRFVAKEFGKENCLIVNILRGNPGNLNWSNDFLRSERIHCIDFPNCYSSPAEMLTAFLAQLASTKSEPANA